MLRLFSLIMLCNKVKIKVINDLSSAVVVECNYISNLLF